ncbi:hypothetical protein ACHAQJ_010323 [Trichoderma viride]
MDPPQDVLDEFYRYVQNDIPLRLIFVPTHELVDRYFIQTHYESDIQKIIEDRVQFEVGKGESDRESAVKQLVVGVVRYGILSHRWLPKGEPTLKDMVEGTAKGPGWDKLTLFCKRVFEYNLNFAWSDTCCIDKTSSSELDESIRSMFRWYRNASVCFIYLAKTTCIDDLPSDEWFERGWTLQELIAPPVIKLFDTKWERLANGSNDKNNRQMLRLLSKASGCPERELHQFKPGPYYVDERMTWAATRKTTRGEDIAYCLMGLFDVTLQTAYGEGAERAFCRLIDMIMQSNGNTSVLNWAGKPASSHRSLVLPSSPRCYVGRRPFNSVRKLDISMTSRGLRIPLLIIPIYANSMEHLSDTTIRGQFSFVDAHLAEGVGNITIDIIDKRIPPGEQWALGVFNYMPPYGNRIGEYPAIRRLSTAYLLHRRTSKDVACHQEIKKGTKVQDDLRFYGWKKASTSTFIDFTLNSLDKREVMVEDKELLQIVYL